MDRWIDPDETDPAQWRQTGPHDELRRGTEMISVAERAVQTAIPYQYEIKIHHTDNVADQFRTSEYEHARVTYNSSIDREKRIKLLTRGVLWGGDEDHQRFQVQYRRPPPPAETVPFGTYSAWSRYQYGSIEETDDGVTFTPADEELGESLRDLDWEAMFDPVQERLVELELVRNPAFAKYRLEQMDEWTTYRTRFRYDPDVFGVGP
ncbi:hypothetical protein [Haloarcula sebkhae]|uniref:Uncharacterized protein n=2 Tax=Haloarcula sebkhae TaxID=932660 RepID=A0ACC6VK81_9EURY|nr:hypothetical protein [Haloarcula sebkhae]GGK69458.1 hypothetical protein GCM10009067_22070 [Haloarcula sebkhae]